jgi:hypothetical protein
LLKQENNPAATGHLNYNVDYTVFHGHFCRSFNMEITHFRSIFNPQIHYTSCTAGKFSANRVIKLRSHIRRRGAKGGTIHPNERGDSQGLYPEGGQLHNYY